MTAEQPAKGPRPDAIAALVAAMLATYDRGDQQAFQFLIEAIEPDEMPAALLASVALATEAARRTPGGVAAWLESLRRMEQGL